MVVAAGGGFCLASLPGWVGGDRDGLLEESALHTTTSYWRNTRRRARCVSVSASDVQLARGARPPAIIDCFRGHSAEGAPVAPIEGYGESGAQRLSFSRVEAGRPTG